jgi:hypothetical protein
MSASQSNLSASKYGYDFVVATTQTSINSTMKEYLSAGTQPEVIVCYVANDQGVPTPIDYQTLKTNAKGSDPFAVPANADPTTNQDILNLYAARFMVGFKAQIGLPPPGYAPANIPDIVSLGSDTSAVSYNLTCSEFMVVQYSPGSGYNPPTWLSITQSPGSAWLFNSKVDLRLLPYNDAFSKLPPAVQAQIKNLGGNAFSIQQLLFDLDNATLESIPTISRVDPSSNLYSCLQKDFLGKYFEAVKQAGQPVLGCSVTQSTAPPTTLTLTDLNFETAPLLGSNGQPITNPSKDQQDACALTYLCAANGHSLPNPAPFDWNWLEESEDSSFDGLISVNRNTFANYIKAQLDPIVPMNCIAPAVRLWWEGIKLYYGPGLNPGQTPTVSMPATGSTVLSYSYSGTSSDQAGLNGDAGAMTLTSTFNLDVVFQCNTIVITQHIVIYADVRVMLTSAAGNVVDKKIVDTYTLTTDAAGELTAALTSVPTDNSQTPGVNGFLNFFTGGINDLISAIANAVRNFGPTNLRNIPVSAIKNFVFPGGKSFVFKDGSFSSFQDLTAHISYADVS